MTEISDLGLQRILLAGFQQADDAAAARQIQIATGAESQRFSGLTGDPRRLLDADGVFARATAFGTAADVAGSFLQIQEAALGEVAGAASDLRAGLVRALANGSGDFVALDAEISANRALSALNASAGDRFAFGGVSGIGDAPPVAAGDAGELVATDPDDLFAASERARLPVAPGVDVDGGPTAAEAGDALLGTLRSILAPPASIGAFDGPLTDAQRDFLVDAVDQVDAAFANLNELQGRNGIAQAEAARAAELQAQQRDLAVIVAAEIESVDLAAAIAGLNQDRLAIEASAQALATASQLSLLNFL